MSGSSDQHSSDYEFDPSPDDYFLPPNEPVLLPAASESSLSHLDNGEERHAKTSRLRSFFRKVKHLGHHKSHHDDNDSVRDRRSQAGGSFSHSGLTDSMRSQRSITPHADGV